VDIPYIRIGGRLISTDSEEGKEYLKWERKPNYNPNAPENQFPRMLYQAHKRPDGIVSVNEVSDVPFGGTMGGADAFNRTCQRIVKGPQEEQAALEGGWHRTQQDALESFERKERLRGDAAAHGAHEDRNMSDLAKAEKKAAEDATPEHVAEVPEKRRVKRTYKRRNAPAAA
jgi:hypothetical protein